MSTPTLSSRLKSFFTSPLQSVTNFGTGILGSIARARPGMRTMVHALLLGAMVTSAVAPAVHAAPMQLNNAQIEAATGLNNDRATGSTAVGVRAWEGRDAGQITAAGAAVASIQAAAPDFVSLGGDHIVNPDAVFLMQYNADTDTAVFAIDNYTTGVELTGDEANAAFAEMKDSGRYINLTSEMLINMDQLTAVSVTGDGVKLSSGTTDERFSVPPEEVEAFLSQLQDSGEYAVSMSDGAVRLASVAHAAVKSGKLTLRTTFGTERLDGMSDIAMEAVMTKLGQGADFYRAASNDVINLNAIRALELRGQGFMARYDGGMEMIKLDQAGKRDLINATRDSGRFFQLGPKLLINADSIGMITVGDRHADYYMAGDDDITRWEDSKYRSWLLEDLQAHPDFVRVDGDTYVHLDSVATMQWVETGQIRGNGRAVLTTAQGQFNLQRSRLEVDTWMEKMKMDGRFLRIGQDLVHKNVFGQFWHTGDNAGQRYTVGDMTFSEDQMTPDTTGMLADTLAERNPDMKKIGGYLVDLDAVAQMKYDGGKLRWQLGERIFETRMPRAEALEIMQEMSEPAPAANQQGSLEKASATKHASLGDMDDFVHFVVERGNDGAPKVVASVKKTDAPRMG
ncbi:MAG: hypothetical protein Alpg2KO_30980 [Alphaproteobacteria bacterium]